MISDFNATKFAKSVERIDLMMANQSRSFQNSCVIETGLHDFHKMTVTEMRSHLLKVGPQIIKYRDYKNFSYENFRSQINKECEKFQSTLEIDPFLDYCSICNIALNETAALKRKYTGIVRL